MAATINPMTNYQGMRLMPRSLGIVSFLQYLVPLALITLYSISVQAAPDIQHWKTGNGARVYYVHAPQLPMVDIKVIFDAGSARDGDKPGLAAFTNGMLEEGAGKGKSTLDADTIADRFDSVGANFSLDSMRDMATLNLRSLTKAELLHPALETMTLVINQPTFPPDALERVRKQMLIGLRYEEQSPSSIASKAYYAALYGDHPYAIPSNGTKKSVTALTGKDLRAFFNRYYVGRNTMVAIVGDLGRTTANEVAEQLVGNLPEGRKAEALPAIATRPA